MLFEALCSGRDLFAEHLRDLFAEHLRDLFAEHRPFIKTAYGIPNRFAKTCTTHVLPFREAEQDISEKFRNVPNNSEKFRKAPVRCCQIPVIFSNNPEPFRTVPESSGQMLPNSCYIFQKFREVPVRFCLFHLLPPNDTDSRPNKPLENLTQPKWPRTPSKRAPSGCIAAPLQSMAEPIKVTSLEIK